MPKVIVIFTEIDEIHEVPTAWLIALPNGQIVTLPKTEYVQVSVSDDPEEIKTEN